MSNMKVSAGFLAEFSKRLAKELGADVSTEGDEDVGEGTNVFTRDNFRHWQELSDKLSSDLETNQKQLLETQQAFDVVSGYAANWKSQSDSSSQLLASLRVDLDKALDLVADLKVAVLDRDKLIESLRNEMIQLVDAHRETTDTEVARLTNALNDTTVTLRNVTAQKWDMETKLADANVKLENTKAELDKVTSQNADQLTIVTEMRSKLATLTVASNDFDAMKKQSEFLATTLETNSVEVKRLSEENEALKSQVANFKQGEEAAYWQGQASFAKADAVNLRKVIATSQAQLDVLKKSEADKAQRIEDMSQSAEFYLEGLRTLTKEKKDLELKLDLLTKKDTTEAK